MTDSKPSTGWQENAFSTTARMARGMDPYRLALGLRGLSWLFGTVFGLFSAIAALSSGLKGILALIAVALVVAALQVMSKLLVIAADQRLMLWTLTDRMAATHGQPTEAPTAASAVRPVETPEGASS